MLNMTPLNCSKIAHNKASKAAGFWWLLLGELEVKFFFGTITFLYAHFAHKVLVSTIEVIKIHI